MSMEHSPGDTGPRPRRGPSVDLDPNGIVTGKGPDRQRRQFLNYSFYRLDPVFRRLPPDEQRAAAAEFIELVRQWESLDDLILRTYSLVGLRADVDFMLWRIAFDPLGGSDGDDASGSVLEASLGRGSVCISIELSRAGPPITCVGVR